jgi:integrase/recombinase XerD
MSLVRYAPPSLYLNDGSRKYLNASERNLLLRRLCELPKTIRLFVLTLMWTGARISEVIALTPQSFQIESAAVAIRTLKRRRHVVREVPIPRSLATALDAHFGIRAKQSDRACARQPLWPFHRVTGWRYIKHVMERAGIHGIRATPRGLRHAFGVATLAAGVPLNIVQRLLGHSSIKTTTIYTEASGPEERAMLVRFWKSGRTTSVRDRANDPSSRATRSWSGNQQAPCHRVGNTTRTDRP